MLEASHLICARGERVLFSDLNFTLAPGEIVHVGGANGSGKTSLLRMLCGLTPAEAGEVRWRGMPVSDETFRRELFYLGHQAAVKEDLSPIENLRIAAALAGDPLREAQALAVLAEIGLEGREYLPTKLLSQGQKRRVALARVLITDAPLWILDEPLTALDLAAVDLIQARMAAHVARQGCVVFTTHQSFDLPGVVLRHIDLN